MHHCITQWQRWVRVRGPCRADCRRVEWRPFLCCVCSADRRCAAPLLPCCWEHSLWLPLLRRTRLRPGSRGMLLLLLLLCVCCLGCLESCFQLSHTCSQAGHLITCRRCAHTQ